MVQFFAAWNVVSAAPVILLNSICFFLKNRNSLQRNHSGVNYEQKRFHDFKRGVFFYYTFDKYLFIYISMWLVY